MMKAIRILMMVVGMMVAGCTPPSPLSEGERTSPRPSPGGEGGGLMRDGEKLPRQSPYPLRRGNATPSQRGTEQAAQKVMDTVVLDEEYYRRMWLFEAVGAGEVELDK